MSQNVVSIMQPAYLPWMGYVDMIDQSDLFILLDTVPVNEKSWQTRNRLVDTNGNEVWLSIPTHSHQGQLLEDVQIANGAWRRKHQRTLSALGKHPELEPLLAIYERRTYTRLVDFTTDVIREIARTLGIRTPIVKASTYGLPKRDNPVDRIADLCERTGATELLDTAGAQAVLNIDWLPVGGNPRWLPIRYHQYQHPTYPQYYDRFVSHMSVVDCLARHGAYETLRLVRSGRPAQENAA